MFHEKEEETNVKKFKVLSFVLALLLIAAAVAGYVFFKQKGDLQKTVDKLESDVGQLSSELDTTRKNAENAAKTAEEDLKAAQQKLDQATADYEKAKEDLDKTNENLDVDGACSADRLRRFVDPALDKRRRRADKVCDVLYDGAGRRAAAVDRAG